MSDSDSGDYGTPTPYGRWQYTGADGSERQWIPDDPSQAVQGRSGATFDPTQVAYTTRPNYEGTPTEYYDQSGNMIGYLGRDNTVLSTGNLNFVDNSGNPLSNATDRFANIQQTDENGNLLFIDPNDEGRLTLKNTGHPATIAPLSSQMKMYEPQSSSLFADPLFRNFLLSAAAMGGAAAFAPALGGAGAGAEAFPVALGDSITMAPLGEVAGAGSLTAGEAATAGLTGADLLKYGQYGLKGLGALQSVAGLANGRNTQGYVGQGGQGGYGGTTMVVNPTGPWNTFLKPGLETVGQANQRPITTGLENLEMLSDTMPSQSYFTYGSPVQTASLPAYRVGGGVLSQYKDGGETHVPEFITGATGHYVKGRGDGQSDDIPAMLADGEYVFDADTVAALGNGSSDAGAKVLDKMREALREHKRSAPVDEIPPKAKSPLEYIKEGMKRK